MKYICIGFWFIGAAGFILPFLGIPDLPEQAYAYVIVTGLACAAILGGFLSSLFVRLSLNLLLPMGFIAAGMIAFVTPGYCRRLEHPMAFKDQTIGNIAIALHLLAFMSFARPIVAAIRRGRHSKSPA